MQGLCQPFLLLAYAAELSSVFLHIRKILLIGKGPSLLRRLNRLCLVATFLLTRIVIPAKALVLR